MRRNTRTYTVGGRRTLYYFLLLFALFRAHITYACTYTFTYTHAHRYITCKCTHTHTYIFIRVLVYIGLNVNTNVITINRFRYAQDDDVTTNTRANNDTILLLLLFYYCGFLKRELDDRRARAPRCHIIISGDNIIAIIIITIGARGGGCLCIIAWLKTSRYNNILYTFYEIYSLDCAPRLCI